MGVCYGGVGVAVDEVLCGEGPVKGGNGWGGGDGDGGAAGAVEGVFGVGEEVWGHLDDGGGGCDGGGVCVGG